MMTLTSTDYTRISSTEMIHVCSKRDEQYGGGVDILADSKVTTPFCLIDIRTTLLLDV